MQFRGRYHIYHKGRLIETVENIVTEAGEQSFLKMIAQADVTDVSSGGNFYIGICGGTPTTTDTLSTLTGEPSGNGYARIAVTRDSTGWPTIGLVNGVYRAQTKVCTFTASGGNFSAPLTRLFLCNVSSGSSGILFSASGALSNPVTIVDGTSYSVRYELYMQ